MNDAMTPTNIVLHQGSKCLELQYGETSVKLPLEYLRVFSPSAEVRGHGLSEPILVLDKADVNVTKIEPVGNYAIRLHFDDGHNTGIFSWAFFETLIRDFEENWITYQKRVARAHCGQEHNE